MSFSFSHLERFSYFSFSPLFSFFIFVSHHMRRAKRRWCVVCHIAMMMVSLWFWCLCGREFNLHNFDYDSVFVVKTTLKLEPREEIWNRDEGKYALTAIVACIVSKSKQKYFHLTLFNRICQNASACLSLILVADFESAWPLCSRHSALHFSI